MPWCIHKYLILCRFLLSRNSPPADYCLARTVSSQVPPRLLPSNWHQPDRADLLEYNSTGHESSVITCSAWHHSGLDLPTGRGSVLFCLNDHGCGRLHNVPHDSLWGVNSFARRHLHTSYILRRDESKVEETLEAIKDKIKKDEQVKPSDAQAPDGSAASTGAITPVTPAVVAVKKKSLREKIVAEVKHYYHGFRLLFIDFRVCARLLWQVLNGKSLMRREQKQVSGLLILKRTWNSSLWSHMMFFVMKRLGHTEGLFLRVELNLGFLYLISLYQNSCCNLVQQTYSSTES